MLGVRIGDLAGPASLHGVHGLQAVEQADFAVQSAGDHGRERQRPLGFDRAVKGYKNTIQVQFSRLFEYLIR